jgi:hypothetical protein
VAYLRGDLGNFGVAKTKINYVPDDLMAVVEKLIESRLAERLSAGDHPKNGGPEKTGTIYPAPATDVPAPTPPAQDRITFIFQISDCAFL